MLMVIRMLMFVLVDILMSILRHILNPMLTCQRMLMMGTLKSLDRRKSSPGEDKNLSMSKSAW